MPRKQQVQQSHTDLNDLPAEFLADAFQLADLHPACTCSVSRLFRRTVGAGAVLNLRIKRGRAPQGQSTAAAAAAADAASAPDLSSLVSLLGRRQQLHRLNITFGCFQPRYPSGDSPLLVVCEAIATKLAASPNITKLSLVSNTYQDVPRVALEAIFQKASGIRSLFIVDKGSAVDCFTHHDVIPALTALQTLELSRVRSCLDFAAPLVQLRALSLGHISDETSVTFASVTSQLTALRFTCFSNIVQNTLGSLQQLRELDMAFTYDASLVAELTGLTLLTRLRLRIRACDQKHSFEPSSSLSKLVNLRFLHIDDLGESSSSFVTCLTALTALTHLRAHNLPEQFSVAASTTLESLVVYGQDFIAAPDSLALLCTLRSLRSLDLTGALGFGPEFGSQAMALTALTGLTALNLFKCVVSKACVQAIRASLTQLVVLDVRKCPGVPKCWTVGVWEDKGDDMPPSRGGLDWPSV